MSFEHEYAGKVALITGAARGIGLCIARRFALAGARVLIVDTNAAAGSGAAAELRDQGLEADFIEIDLAQRGAAERMVERGTSLAGSLDILVNNARAGRRLGVLDETEENWDLANTVGLKAAFFAAQAAIRRMAATGGGAILNVASVAAALSTNESPSYHATKAGLLHLTRYLAVAAGRHGVRTNAVLPGLIVQEEHRLSFYAASNKSYREMASFYQPLGNIGSEADVAEAALFLCSERARYLSGVCLVIDGGATLQEQFALLLRWQAQSQRSSNQL